MKTSKTAHFHNPWPHRLAVTLAWTTFPLIWVGSLVTTYDAGMAVPDWPSTYGYNLLFYPWQTWIAGPWDLFIEHGHRLLGAFVGLITIAFLVVTFRCDRRRWMQWMALGMLIAVIAQGVLGGSRVLFDSRFLALIHGCTGPIFFSLTVIACVLTSPHTTREQAGTCSSAGHTLQRLSLFTAIFAFLQLVLGAHLRHVAVDTSHEVFRVTVFFHLLMATVVLAHGIALALHVRRHFHDYRPLRRAANGLALLLCLQMMLGGATWVVKYSWPTWLADFQFAASYTVTAQSLPQSLIVTAHVALGSLILATALMLFVRSLHLLQPSLNATSPNHRGLLGVVV
ncbi:MAG: COX15/CtaA family protein [Pirellulaceae bacterium]|nr:COX15/CtaA family protein [Pirellulaceae bacterium]